MRIDNEQVERVVHLLCEGVGIRAISRLTNLHKQTVLNILESAGEKAQRFLDANIRNVKAEQVQADELVSFVFGKDYTVDPNDETRGTFFTYLSVDRASKLIINHRTAKRSKEDTDVFLTELKNRVSGRFQLTTDGWSGYAGYTGAVQRIFGRDSIDYATESKRYASSSGLVRYERRRVVGLRRRAKMGNPDMKLATTCHCERTNLSVRIFNRRFTRLTLGYSKKLENLRHAVALFVWHFNFVRVHSAHKSTPAQAAGLAYKHWTIRDFVESTI